MQLDLSATMSGFFVTTDCSNNEGLSFVISDFGVYFNNTSISTLFEESNISIRNNMEDNYEKMVGTSFAFSFISILQ